MPTFQYEAMNNVGQPMKGNVDAASSEDAISKIRAMGNFPTKIRESGGKGATKVKKKGPRAAAASRPTTRRVGHVKTKLLTQFTRQLSTLQDAGLPILRSLRILQEQQKPGPLRVAIRLVAEDVESGLSLSESMGKYPRAFDRLYVNMVRAGELGGVLDLILQRLAEFMERTEALRRKIIGAMIYPVAVIFFALVIVMGLMVFVVPKFKQIFSEQGDDLPAITASLLGFSEWIMGGGWLWIIGLPVCIVILTRILRSTEGGSAT